MSKIEEAAVLKCECGSAQFTPVVNLRWKENTGMTTAPAGHMCAACHIIADNAYLIRREQVRLKRQETRAAEAELAELETAAARPVKANQNVRV